MTALAAAENTELVLAHRVRIDRLRTHVSIQFVTMLWMFVGRAFVVDKRRPPGLTNEAGAPYRSLSTVAAHCLD